MNFYGRQSSNQMCLFTIALPLNLNIQIMFQIESTLSSKSNTSSLHSLPLTIEAQESAGEALSVLAKLEGDEDAAELAGILTKPWLESLLDTHDRIGALKTNSQFSSNNEDDGLLERLSHYNEHNIKVVRIGKHFDTSNLAK